MLSILWLRSLTPLQALMLLADAGAVVKGQGLADIKIKIWLDPQGYEAAKVVLALPDPRATTRGVSTPLASALLDGYHRIYARGEQYCEDLPAGSLALRPGVAQLLWLADQEGQSARPVEHEYLLLATAADVEQVQQTLATLTRHATYVTLSAADRPEDRLHLFHIFNDPRRNGSFMSLLESRITTSRVLAAYKVDDWHFFAQRERPPSRLALEAFVRLAQAAPKLFTDSQQADGSSMNGSKLLAALLGYTEAVPDTPNGRFVVELLYLRHLVFHGQSTFTPPPSSDSRVLFYDLTTSAQALTQLRQSINEAGQRVGVRIGYHLRLRPTRVVNDYQVERLRLQEQKEAIQSQIEYLDSVAGARPHLLRFTHDQLSALADYVRSFPLRVLSQGLLQYGFQSTAHDGSGMHFILVDPRQASLEAMDPLPKWERRDQPPIRFWLDPFWARFYAERNEQLIFVPHGSRLMPTMHAASPQQMDAYMREVLGQWYKEEYGMPPIPAQPLYLFDPRPGCADHIDILVLDRAQFVPLDQKLDWINFNLHLRRAQHSNAPILQQLSDALTEEELLSSIRSYAATTENALQQAEAATAHQLAAATGEITEVLASELQQALDQSRRTHKAIVKAQQELRELTHAQREIETLLADSEASIKQTDALADATATTIAVLRRKVDSELAQAQAAHAHAEGSITQLQELYRRLRQLLRQRP